MIKEGRNVFYRGKGGGKGGRCSMRGVVGGKDCLEEDVLLDRDNW